MPLESGCRATYFVLLPIISPLGLALTTIRRHVVWLRIIPAGLPDHNTGKPPVPAQCGYGRLRQQLPGCGDQSPIKACNAARWLSRRALPSAVIAYQDTGRRSSKTFFTRR